MTERPTGAPKNKNRTSVTFNNQIQSPPFSPLEIINRAKGIQKSTDKLLASVPQFTDTIDLNIHTDGPIRIIPISDTHLFSMLTDYDLVKETVIRLNEPNTFAVICGDFLEGANPNIGSHISQVMLSLTDQVLLAKDIIEPFVNNGKILAVVGMYNGHEEWSERLATFNAIRILTDRLYQPDGSRLKAVINGGDLTIRFDNNREFKMGLFHDAGGGGSDEVNPLGAPRKQGWKRPLNSSLRRDLELQGHRHHQAAYSEEDQTNKLTGKTEVTVYASLGAYKSVSPKRPDSFLIAQGQRESKKPGFGMVLNIGNENKRWSTFGFDKLGHLYKAATYFDKAEKSGMTSELIQTIESRNEFVQPKFDRKNSRAQIPENDESRVPLYDLFDWKIDDKLPSAVYMTSHGRYGSASGDRNRFKNQEIVSAVCESSRAYLLVLRHMLDPDVAKMPNRLDILNQLINDLKPAYDEHSLLGMMLSAKSFTGNKSWSKDLHDGDRVVKKIRPGDLIYKKLLPKTPLFKNDKLMRIQMGGIDYLFLLMDELARSGSGFNMFQGLVQSHRKTRLNLDVVAGGHMMGAGVMQTEQTTYIAPGWAADFDSYGPANQTVGPEGGQGIILLPNEREVIAATSLVEMKDMHRALTLKFGLTDKEKASLMRRKVR